MGVFVRRFPRASNNDPAAVFHWFNRKFDIEKKPLQSIGLVAGALVALVYWAVAIVSRLL